MDSPPLLLLWTADAKVVRSVETVAGEHGLSARRTDTADPADTPAVVVVDLDAPGAFDALVDVRQRWPEALVAGHLGLPDRDRWLAAERAGCDIVANRGALAAALRKRLAAGAPRRGRRVPLFALNDAAGRLGVVHREHPARSASGGRATSRWPSTTWAAASTPAPTAAPTPGPSSRRARWRAASSPAPATAASST